MICEIFKKIYDYIIFFILSFINALIPDTSTKNKDYMDRIIRGQILYIKSDSLLFEEPNSFSNIILVINKGTKVEYLNETVTKR